jgi:hypothetical protein
MKGHSGVTAGLVAACALLLTGCGGGGGGSTSDGYTGPTTRYAMDSAMDADQAASYAVDEVVSQSIVSDADAFRSTAPAGSDPGSTLARAKALADSLLATHSGAAKRNVYARGTQSGSQQCAVSGSVSGTVYSQSDSADSDGDYMQLNFSNCNDGDGYIYNGSLRLTLVSVANEIMEMRFIGLTVSGLESEYANGAYRIDLAADGYVIYGDSLVWSDSTAQVRLTGFRFDYSLNIADSSATFAADYTVASTTIGGTLTVDTTTPFVRIASESYPRSGVVVVTGASGASVRASAQSATYVRLEYDLDADGTYGIGSDPAFQDVAWGDL